MEDQEINNRAYIEPIEKFTDGYDYLEFKKKNDSQYVLEINDLILIVDMPNVFSSGIYWARFERKTINGECDVINIRRTLSFNEAIVTLESFLLRYVIENNKPIQNHLEAN